MKASWTAALLVLVALAIPVAGCGGDDEEATETPTATEGEAGESVMIELSEQSSSGESGTATLEAVSSGMTRVTIELENAPAEPQPAHIHSGSCAELGDVVHPLTNVEGGSSETEVAASLEDLQSGDFAINVHQSEADIGTYVACGDIA